MLAALALALGLPIAPTVGLFLGEAGLLVAKGLLTAAPAHLKENHEQTKADSY